MSQCPVTEATPFHQKANVLIPQSGLCMAHLFVESGPSGVVRTMPYVKQPLQAFQGGSEAASWARGNL